MIIVNNNLTSKALTQNMHGVSSRSVKHCFKISKILLISLKKIWYNTNRYHSKSDILAKT